MNLLLALFISILNLYPVQIDTTSIQPEINDIIVYRQQAQITRTTTVQLKTGKNTIMLKGFSPYLIQGSIQFKGDKSFTILSLNTRYNYFEEHTPSPTISKLEAKKDSLEKELILINSKFSVLNRQIQLLENTDNMINNQEMSPSELAQLLDFYQERMSALELNKITMNEQITATNNQLNKVISQLNELGYGQPKRFSEVIAEVYSENDKSLNIEIQYLVRNAGWNPSYDIKGSDILSPLQISYKANVYQNTGIDWNDKNLSISSANPTLSSTLPSIVPVSVGFKTQQLERERVSGLNEVVVTGYSQKADMDTNMELPVPPAETIQFQTSFNYKFQIPYSIPSDGKEHLLEFRREEVNANYIYSTVPKYSEKAYLTGKITDWDDLNLIPGKASIYFENNYIGSTQIGALAFDDSLQISLGLDEEIFIERKKLREFEERNFFGNKVIENHSLEISLRNTKNEPVTVIVKDQVPLSQDEDISVDVTALSGGSMNKETGIITWKVVVKPSETKKIRLGFKIEYPKGSDISY